MSGDDLKSALEQELARHPRIRTMSALADAAGIRRATLYAWFTGSIPHMDSLDRVARVLDISPAKLWAAVGGIQLQTEDEHRIADLVLDAYERGLAEGRRIEREMREQRSTPASRLEGSPGGGGTGGEPASI